jgi:uncharacterized protein
MEAGMSETTTFGFPFAVANNGRVQVSGGDKAIRGKIIQVLFTAPGERVNKPDFGCGLLNLVFEPNNSILAAALEFTVGQALTRWLGGDIIVEQIRVETAEAMALVEIVYARRQDLARQAVRVQFR